MLISHQSIKTWSTLFLIIDTEEEEEKFRKLKI